VGLLSAMSNVEPQIILEKNDVFVEYKGAMTEQYAAGQLIAAKSKPYYFSSDDAKTEVDFLIEQNGMVIPIEVKSAANLASKSLKFIIEKHNITKAVKFSILPEKQNQTIYNLPLYLAININDSIS
jgi:predicted AAA+ superfamily ATPase